MNLQTLTFKKRRKIDRNLLILPSINIFLFRIYFNHRYGKFNVYMHPFSLIGGQNCNNQVHNIVTTNPAELTKIFLNIFLKKDFKFLTLSCNRLMWNLYIQFVSA